MVSVLEAQFLYTDISLNFGFEIQKARVLTLSKPFLCFSSETSPHHWENVQSEAKHMEQFLASLQEMPRSRLSPLTA